MSYSNKSGFKGNRTSAHSGGTYKGQRSHTENWSNGRRDTYYGGKGGALGKNHGHRVTTASGFPIYDRKPGNRKKTQAESYGLLDALFGVKRPKGKKF
ncbi:hypothetical protein SBI67_26930 [Mycolicibacterium sp. 120266]|uniref:hypothetical protein n=1 Tax=Mycolicibacterium sp. 120266 TaxID=3090601 RepID=UPI00299EB48E|nr:hypothetical protein [Mycolicibacterium sp. 120266]MDX1875769.1 hypothetical protein [Mycolicibacterium sp. 120266]